MEAFGETYVVACLQLVSLAPSPMRNRLLLHFPLRGFFLIFDIASTTPKVQLQLPVVNIPQCIRCGKDA